ncbi:MAG: hypothetical protein MMC33_006327 [Icmadophila ericetorum]|nr:hypothetical protein [Icmadophila ericetorum]
MTLEDFEKSLQEEKAARSAAKARHGSKSKDHKRHQHRTHGEHHRDRDHRHRTREDGHRHKRRRHSIDKEEDEDEIRSNHKRRSNGLKEELSSDDDDERAEKIVQRTVEAKGSEPIAILKRDSWMETPSALDIEYSQRGARKPPPEPLTAKPVKADFQLKIHDNELNRHHLQDLADGKDVTNEVLNEPAQHGVDYTFGDAGSQWRMTKLKAVYRQAEGSGRPVDEVAAERYGGLRDFDDAREEEIELARRDTYGEGYVGKNKPSGELFQERKLDMDVRREKSRYHDESADEEEDDAVPEIKEVKNPGPSLDQTALNRLKAQMMKAKLRNSPDYAKLEAEYNLALSGGMSTAAPAKGASVVVLNTMENRMLAGGRRGEVKEIDNRRGRERGLVEENEDMSIEDMLREERRTRTQRGGEAQKFAERIAKDAKFSANLDYMDENASKLAKRVQSSSINLRNTAISEYQKINRILDACPLCHHEDTDTPPAAAVVSLATRVYLTLPPPPELCPGSTVIVPIQHHTNLLECDSDEWEEIRNFQKSLARYYASLSPPRAPLFYENAAFPGRRGHACMFVVPLPEQIHAQAPAFFRTAILSQAGEWSQHKKIIDTLSNARDKGWGKSAFRRSLVKEMPYFHVWFQIDGGVGHIVEDEGSGGGGGEEDAEGDGRGGRGGWPKGDRFARETIGGMVGAGMEVVRGRGRWEDGKGRVEGFRKGWGDWDWSKVLTDA